MGYFYLDRAQLEFKANQDREKTKGSIPYNKLFQSDLISRNVSSLFQICFTSVTCLARAWSIYWYNILLKQWKRCLNFHVLIQLRWVRIPMLPGLIRCKKCIGCAWRCNCKMIWKHFIEYKELCWLVLEIERKIVFCYLRCW